MRRAGLPSTPRGLALGWMPGVLLLLLGCSARGAAGVDGQAPDTPASHGQLSFDVVATLTATAGPVAAGGGLPSTGRFTLVLDGDAHRIIAGGGGRAGVMAVTSADGRTFRASTGFSVGVPGNGCSGLSELRYDTLEVTVTGSSLRGHATGSAQISCGDCIFATMFSADLQGTPDITAPFIVASGAAPADPFVGFGVVASEPLPMTSTARLVAGDGSFVGLAPVVVAGDVPVITGFSKPNVVLAHGEGFVVSVEGLVDFAGRSGASEAPLRVATFGTAPLVPEDGFESAAGTTLGGATVISSGPLPPLAGTQSVYIGGSGAPTLTGRAPGTALEVRLALQPGDTKLRFSYRVVSSFGIAGFGATVNVGSVGHAASAPVDLPPVVQATQVTWTTGQTVSESALLTMEVALPADVTDELLVEIATLDGGCGARPPGAGVLIDDLRAE
jgi:hypothetical protein